MKGDHQTSLTRAREALEEAVKQFVQCRAYTYNAFVKAAVDKLQSVSDRAVFPTSQCPYCGEPTKYAPNTSVLWTCACFDTKD